MKNLKILLCVLSIIVTTGALAQSRVEAKLNDYKINDTIQLADFLKLTEISLNTSGYSVLSFNMTMNDNGYDFSELSNSNKITDAMRKLTSNIKDKEKIYKTIYFENIFALSSKGEKVNVPPLIYKLKVK